MSEELAEHRSRRLHYALEHEIKQINRERIAATVGSLSRARFQEVAALVADMRADYLNAVVNLGANCRIDGEDGAVDTACVLELKRLREAYYEGMEGFSALEHALEREYLALGTD